MTDLHQESSLVLRPGDKYRSFSVNILPEEPEELHLHDVRKERHFSLIHRPSVMEYYSDYLQTPQIVAMVGLPARGKTYISKKLCRYLNWIGFRTKVFNLGEYRRMKSTYEDHSLFKKGNLEGEALREQCAIEALEDTCLWFENGGEIAIIDATNSTRERREMIKSVVDEKGYKLFYVESICTDPEIIKKNITEVKVFSPDYKEKTTEEVVKDFTQRIQHYAEQYMPLDEKEEPDVSFIKLINAGESVEIHKHEGPIQSRIIYYLMNLHILPRNIYFTRHGESEFNLSDRVGGDSELSPRGKEYALALAKFVAGMNIPDLRVWTSVKQRTISTAEHIACPQERWKVLNEIDVGICDGMSYEEVAMKYPGIRKAREMDKFHYRYPHGENYQDVTERLEPVIMELERQSNVLVVCHEAVLRCLLGYFLDIPQREIPYIYVPLHTFFRLSPITYGCKVQHIKFPIPCVETFVPKVVFILYIITAMTLVVTQIL
ncbi:6-phosphofructo-2-kinase/fructose-2,6-bisphosphatase 4-like [Periplaneta americana]|uniref:6-phosphofructo-2-kinase/fructose-2, 6-bisphosphatase 4-like n=1 Tax=Periplaneta americana TaxID=6978 RepID=UPI0037E90988